jgi:hypothetical protein
MTLSEVREGLPFKVISRHVKSHQDDERYFDDLTRPKQLNVLANHRATAALDKLRAAGKTTALYPLPACRGYLRDGTGGHITSRARSEPNFLSASFESICNTRRLVKRDLQLHQLDAHQSTRKTMQHHD